MPGNLPRPPPTNNSSNNVKPSIKIHEQKASTVIGDNYNYWYVYDYSGGTIPRIGRRATSQTVASHSMNNQ